ncbi:flagellar assembly protein T N-terminal domain-containing protein [Neptuniibacter marinus]|uniref:flagellar assembly protein T N-terminal domain-containing protein n=1 Tax=Neptuniibacter marinus TaxID=1806670 RepID=UPI000833C42C|nr:flagellar assembly protein T N-terminal domain-containing protein [Neptuniibacter marinus]
MFNKTLNFLIVSLFLSLTSIAQAVVIEAEGQAIIANKNITAAREAAIRDASQQASMQAAVYVSSSQVVRDGILEIDNMQISSLGQVSNIEILDEKIIGSTLHIRIKANVDIDEGCSNGSSNNYKKTIAFAAFPLQQLSQANLGGLHNVSSELPAQLSQRFNSTAQTITYNAGLINLYPNPSQASSSQLDSGKLTSMLSTIGQLDVNYVISGVIRDISMVDPRTHAENNYFMDLYNRLDFKSKRHLRNFEIDLFIHDGFSGQLVSQKHYQTAGLWSLDHTITTGFATPGFIKQDYGQKVRALEDKIAAEISAELRCEPFSTRITQVEDRTIWINAGKQHGLKRGDKLTIYRSSTIFTPQMNSNTQLTNTQQTLIIDDVQMGFASGHINASAETYNIRAGDLAIAR